MGFTYSERLNLSIFAVMLLRFTGLSQVKVARKLNCSKRWVEQVCRIPKYMTDYSQVRKQIAEEYLLEQIQKNPEENLIKWYPKLLKDMKDAAEGKIKDKTRIMAIQKLFEIAEEYKKKMRPAEQLRPIMSDEKAEEMHKELKLLITLHRSLIGKLNICPRENLTKILGSS